MPQIITQADGTELEVYTKEEVTETQNKIGILEAEMENLRKTNGEISVNFKRYRDMNDEEKSMLSESEKQANIQMGILQDQVNEMKKQAEADKALRLTNLKEAVLNKFCQGDKEMREKMTQGWDLVNIDVVDERTAFERGRIAFAASGGILSDSQKNPLFMDLSGDAPTKVPGPKETRKEKAEEFITSERGKAAQAAMGVKTE